MQQSVNLHLNYEDIGEEQLGEKSGLEVRYQSGQHILTICLVENK